MYNIKALFFVLGLILFFLTLKSSVFAESDYVLPYPSFMPGSRWYVIQESIDKIKKYWYFGSFAQFKYHLSQSDKYLVETKTLFEYKQYLLGYQSLRKSNVHFLKLKPFLKAAEKDGKRIEEKRKILNMAALKHIETLNSFSLTLPKTFEWKPEKEVPTVIHFEQLIDTSIEVRKKAL